MCETGLYETDCLRETPCLPWTSMPGLCVSWAVFLRWNVWDRLCVRDKLCVGWALLPTHGQCEIGWALGAEAQISAILADPLDAVGIIPKTTGHSSGLEGQWLCFSVSSPQAECLLSSG